MTKEMILLGAGASMDAGIPAAYQMTNEMINRLTRNPRTRKEANVLTYVVGGLLFNLGKNGLNPISNGVNIEEAFNAIQLISERDKSEAAPFIESWHYFINDLDKKYDSIPRSNLKKLIFDYISKEFQNAISASISAYNYQPIDKSINQIIDKKIEDHLKNRSSSSVSGDVGRSIEAYLKLVTTEWKRKMSNSSSSMNSDDITKEIDKIIKASTEKPGAGLVFQRTNQVMIALLKDLVYLNDSVKTEYMAPILNILDTQNSLTIATLNYDNVIELLSQSYGVSVNTGLTEWPESGEIEIHQNGINLIKIHGSITWAKSESNSFRSYSAPSAMPSYKVVDISSDQMNSIDFVPAVIFGGRNKLTADGPFLDLLNAFNSELKDCDLLTVIGYSFRDPHINVYISRWLNRRQQNKIRIINGPNFEEQAMHGILPEYARNLLSLSNTNKFEVIPLHAKDGITFLYGGVKTRMVSPVEVAESSAFDNIIKDEQSTDHEVA